MELAFLTVENVNLFIFIVVTALGNQLELRFFTD